MAHSSLQSIIYTLRIIKQTFILIHKYQLRNFTNQRLNMINLLLVYNSLQKFNLKNYCKFGMKLQTFFLILIIKVATLRKELKLTNIVSVLQKVQNIKHVQNLLMFQRNFNFMQLFQQTGN